MKTQTKNQSTSTFCLFPEFYHKGELFEPASKVDLSEFLNKNFTIIFDIKTKRYSQIVPINPETLFEMDSLMILGGLPWVLKQKLNLNWNEEVLREVKKWHNQFR